MNISAQTDASIKHPVSHWRDYLELCKPRVVLLMILTSMVGMALVPAQYFSWPIFFIANIGIVLVAFGAAVVNHIVDRHIDCLMRRTEKRPIVQGKVSTKNAIIFSAVLSIIGITILIKYVNGLTATLTFLSLVGYAGIYTFYLKHATSQNIVIGGLAGATPPLLGWVAMTGHIDLNAIWLVLIIFVWTPPHFWALAIYRVEDYAKADVPMLPVTHGIPYTKLNILIYTIILFFVTLLPFFTHLFGWIYLIAAIILNARFIHWAIRLLRTDDPRVGFDMFRYSIIYLMLLFVAMLADRFI